MHSCRDIVAYKTLCTANDIKPLPDLTQSFLYKEYFPSDEIEQEKKSQSLFNKCFSLNCNITDVEKNNLLKKTFKVISYANSFRLFGLREDRICGDVTKNFKDILNIIPGIDIILDFLTVLFYGMMFFIDYLLKNRLDENEEQKRKRLYSMIDSVLWFFVNLFNLIMRLGVTVLSITVIGAASISGIAQIIGFLGDIIHEGTKWISNIRTSNKELLQYKNDIKEIKKSKYASELYFIIKEFQTLNGIAFNKEIAHLILDYNYSHDAVDLYYDISLLENKKFNYHFDGFNSTFSASVLCAAMILIITVCVSQPWIIVAGGLALFFGSCLTGFMRKCYREYHDKKEQYYKSEIELVKYNKDELINKIKKPKSIFFEPEPIVENEIFNYAIESKI